MFFIKYRVACPLVAMWVGLHQPPLYKGLPIVVLSGRGVFVVVQASIRGLIGGVFQPGC